MARKSDAENKPEIPQSKGHDNTEVDFFFVISNWFRDLAFGWVSR
jgi:hypothetical protein